MKHIVLSLFALFLASTLMAQSFQSLNVDQFVKLVDDDSVLVVDVRTRPEYQSGHIKGAVNVVWDKDFDAHLKAAALDKQRTLAVYCRSGRRSKQAAAALVKAGYRVVELDKGILAWQAANHSLVKD